MSPNRYNQSIKAVVTISSCPEYYGYFDLIKDTLSKFERRALDLLVLKLSTILTIN
jgi:hypothetical protein